MRACQAASGLDADGEYGPLTHAALMLAADQGDAAPSVPEAAGGLKVKSGTWNLRTGPGTSYPIAAVVRGGDGLCEAQSAGWVPVIYNGEIRWISEKAVE